MYLVFDVKEERHDLLTEVWLANIHYFHQSSSHDMNGIFSHGEVEREKQKEERESEIEENHTVQILEKY